MGVAKNPVSPPTGQLGHQARFPQSPQGRGHCRQGKGSFLTQPGNGTHRAAFQGLVNLQAGSGQAAQGLDGGCIILPSGLDGSLTRSNI